MSLKKQIIDLFGKLSSAEQIELLKELSSNSGTSISIADFSVKHQKRYGGNLEFTITQAGLDHAPVITAVVHTNYGDFTGKGSNQKIAKANAVSFADKAWR